jgi:uncharacterized protein
MIAVDTQILVYAHRPEMPLHERARRCMSSLAQGTSRWAIPLHCLVEFYGLVTNRQIFRAVASSSPDQAIDQIDAWLESPMASVLADDVATWPVLRDLLGHAQITGPSAHDARVAAVCLRHGVTELWTNDRDFLRFPALRVRNPLVDPGPTRAGEEHGRYVTRVRRPESPRRTRARASGG